MQLDFYCKHVEKGKSSHIAISNFEHCIFCRGGKAWLCSRGGKAWLCSYKTKCPPVYPTTYLLNEHFEFSYPLYIIYHENKKDQSSTDVIGALRVDLLFLSYYQAHQLIFQVKIQQIPGNMSPTGCQHGRLDLPTKKM